MTKRLLKKGGGKAVNKKQKSKRKLFDLEAKQHLSDGSGEDEAMQKKMMNSTKPKMMNLTKPILLSIMMMMMMMMMKPLHHRHKGLLRF